MRHLTLVATALLTIVCSAPAADRVVMVIGNAGYQTLPKLPACERDAKLIADIFSTKLGISIHGGKPLNDLTASQMDDALHAFAAKLGPETEAYLYFSGHGVQADGVNYLLPVDYSAKYKVQLKRQAVSLDDVLAVLEESKAKLRVIILDSCRSPGEFLPGEPGEKGFSRKGGLAEQKVENPDTLVCFATKHGTPAFSPDAFDTTSTSLYTSVLAEEILKPGKIEDVLKNVAIGVYAKTERQQLPFTYGSLLHNFSFLPSSASVITRTETPMPSFIPAPAPVVPPPSDSALQGASKNTPFVNSLGQRFVPTGMPNVLFSIYDTRVKDFAAFVESTGYDAISESANGDAAYTLERSNSTPDWKQAGGSWKDPRFGTKQTGEHPVVCVSYLDAENFCGWLTKTERASGKLPADWSYRLPTDAEWSHACGNGEFPWGDRWPPRSTDGNYCGGEAMVGAYNGLSNPLVKEGFRDAYARTSPVGSFTENRYGLYDMGGNVRQWCSTWYTADLNDDVAKKIMPGLNDDRGGIKYRVLRGAAWYDYIRVSLRSAFRPFVLPRSRIDFNGFRCVVSGGPH